MRAAVLNLKAITLEHETVDRMTSSKASAGSSDHRTIDVASSLTSYFHDELSSIFSAQKVDIQQDTLWYLSTLLHNYSRSDKFFDFHADSGITLTPLADYYRYSVEASNDRERRLHLQRLGDVSIFVAGLFASALKRKAVGVDYYVAMGENAYGYLADCPASSTRDRALEATYQDLARHFSTFATMISFLRPGFDHSHQLFNWHKNREPLFDIAGCSGDAPGLCH